MTTVNAPTPQPNLYRPVLLRGLVSLIFGLGTVFVPDLSAGWRAGLTGLFLAGNAAAALWLSRFTRRVLAAASRGLSAEAGFLLVVGLGIVLLRTGQEYRTLAVAALGVAGLIELVLGVRHRRGTVLGRDWLSVGGIWVLGAIVLGLIGHASSRAPIGVMGGVAVITGVVLVLAALSYRHDAKIGSPARAETGTGRTE